MSAEVDISEFEQHLRQLRAGEVEMTIGYTAHYAIFVHENLKADHSGARERHIESIARKKRKTEKGRVRMILSTMGGGKFQQGQAKFLEVSLQQSQKEQMLERSIALELKSITEVSQFQDAIIRGVLKTGVQTLGNSQQICPVRTGFLSNSAIWFEPVVK
jgi:hypothetical protein